MRPDKRYVRQIQLSEIGPLGQSVLANAHVVIVGAGGLGCTVAVQLAGAGVGHITVVDHDTIDVSNLHRQVLFREADIGLYKAEVAQRELQALNSSIKIQSHVARLSPSNALELCKNADLLIDAADNFAVSYLLSDVGDRIEKPLLSASINKTFGYLGLFGNGAPNLRAVFPRLPQEQINCETAGVTGPGVGIIASLQAQEAIKCLLGVATLQGKLLYYDVWQFQQHLIDVANADIGSHRLALIGTGELRSADYIIDVRNTDEIETAPHAFSVDQHIPLIDILATPPVLPETRVVFVCRSGQRAMLAAQRAIDHGHSQVAALLPD